MWECFDTLKGCGGFLWMVGTTTAQNMKQSRQSDTQLHFHKTIFTYRRTDVYFETLNQMIETAVSFQTVQSDAKRQVLMNLIY
jgi:hypothetical protein